MDQMTFIYTLMLSLPVYAVIAFFLKTGNSHPLYILFFTIAIGIWVLFSFQDINGYTGGGIFSTTKIRAYYGTATALLVYHIITFFCFALYYAHTKQTLYLRRLKIGFGLSVLIIVGFHLLLMYKKRKETREEIKENVVRAVVMNTDIDSVWNLKLANQPGFTKAMAQSQIQPFYDERDRDGKLDGIEEKPEERDINNLHFFQTPAGVYALVVVQNIGREDPGVSGWCDIWLFERKNSKWLIAGRKLKAGGGGTNGYAGEFKELVRVGQNTVGVVITGSVYHSGHSLSFDDVIAIDNRNIEKLVSISTYIDNAGDVDRIICSKNMYKFLPSKKKNYDLHIITINCINAKKQWEVGKVVVPYLNKKYKIPNDFKFEL